MQIEEARNFRNFAKRLHPNQKADLDDAVRTIMDDPAIGELKAGDLTGLRVHKFRMVNQLTLLAYRYDDQTAVLMLEALGSHENFYRDLRGR